MQYEARTRRKVRWYKPILSLERSSRIALADVGVRQYVYLHDLCRSILSVSYQVLYMPPSVPGLGMKEEGEEKEEEAEAEAGYLFVAVQYSVLRTVP